MAQQFRALARPEDQSLVTSMQAWHPIVVTAAPGNLTPLLASTAPTHKQHTATHTDTSVKIHIFNVCPSVHTLLFSRMMVTVLPVPPSGCLLGLSPRPAPEACTQVSSLAAQNGWIVSAAWLLRSDAYSTIKPL